MPRYLSVGPELGHDLVEPDVGGLQGLVEHVEAGGAHVKSSHDRTVVLAGERTVPSAVPTLSMLFVRRNRLKVPAKFSSHMVFPLRRCRAGPDPWIIAGGFGQRDGTRAATAAAAGI